ncbi:M23 family metallopeptidase [Trujillonella humicola]|uniref:M23 family metallopeptidase n=1 Tax=Trujillonella humicola TaxID=3383699 RepID=UPI0039062190
MSQLHHDPVLDEATAPVPGPGTPLDGKAAAAPARPVPPAGEVPPIVPGPRPEGTSRRGSGWPLRLRARRALRPAPAEADDRTHLTAPEDLADLTGQAEATALAGLGEVADEAAAPVVVPAPADEPAADADAEAADGEAAETCTVPVVRAGRGRHRTALARRRPVVYLAAALVTAAGLGVVAGAETRASAEPAQPVGESVSVARALGIEDTAPEAPAPVVAEAAQLAEMAASRTTRDMERYAAAVAQQEADQLTELALAEAARPRAVLPVQGARLTSGFGPRWGTMHSGIDLAAPMYTPEYAAMDGVVLEAGPASGYGNVIYIQHENGDVTVYGHMEEILVAPGQVVRAGDTIALLGNRGQSTGPHLHFEVHVGGLNGTKVDPIPWLRERGVDI